MRYQQAFFVGQKFLGFAERAPQNKCNLRNLQPVAYAFFCPVCGEVWARCPIEDTLLGGTSLYQSITARCQKHPEPLSLKLPGSLWLSWDREFSDSFPDDLVRYEFNLLMQLYKEE